MSYILPILIFALLGILAGILLTVVSKKFAVEVNENIENIIQILPNINCGACGYAGCADYAGALVNKNENITLCKPGGLEATHRISEILGVEAVDHVQEVACIHCNKDCKKKFEFDGESSCKAANRYFRGENSCANACLGYGDCINVCEFGAITICNNIAVIDKTKCCGCGKCVEICPKHVLEIRPKSKDIQVQCSSKDNGKFTKQNCKNGCVACKICEKKCSEGAIKVQENCAHIDYTKCINCKACVSACPQKCII